MTHSLKQDIEEIREQLAEIEHQRWADWQTWCHKILRENCPSPELEKVLERWDRQIATPYKDLTETEKDSDREQVDRYLPLIHKACNQSRIDELKRIKNGTNTILQYETVEIAPTPEEAKKLTGDANTIYLKPLLKHIERRLQHLKKGDLDE